MKLYAPKEAAAVVGVHPKTFRRWAGASGIRPAVLRPNCRRFTLEQVLAISNSTRGARP